MRDGVDSPVTRAEEGTQNPAHEADHNGSEKRIPEAIHRKRRDDLGHKHQHQGIHHQNEKAHRYNDEGDAEQEQNWPNEGIDDSQKERGPKEGAGALAMDSRNDFFGSEYGDGRYQPANQESSHSQKLIPVGFF